MSCPTCGSTDYCLIADGVAECAGQILRPTGRHPSGTMGPAQEWVPCATRFQVPKRTRDGVLCSWPQGCGLEAVARCVECGASVCLDHAFRTLRGVMCQVDARKLADEARRSADEALAAAHERLAGALRMFRTAASGREPELHLRHRLVDKERLPSVRIGTECVEHGPVCYATSVSESGRLRRRVHSAEFDMGAWVLQHRCPHNLHRDPYTEGSSGTAIDLVAVAANGRIYKTSAYGRMANAHPTTWLEYTPERLLASDERWDTTFRAAWAHRIDDLADRLERLVSGVRHLGAIECRGTPMI